jgi:hypothetical protein
MMAQRKFSTGDCQVQQTLVLQKCKNLLTKYTPNSNSRMTSSAFVEFLVHLDQHIGAKNWKNLSLH